MKKPIEHTVFRNQALLCLNCGSTYPIQFPIEIRSMTKKIKAFNVLHKDCEKTCQHEWVSIPTHGHGIEDKYCRLCGS